MEILNTEVDFEEIGIMPIVTSTFFSAIKDNLIAIFVSMAQITMSGIFFPINQRQILSNIILSSQI